MLASIITIGDELLLGQTIDTNSAWLGQQLQLLGITVGIKYAIPDKADIIINTLELAMHQSELIIVTGGLGPTNDDITKATLAKHFNFPLAEHAETKQRIENYFVKAKREAPKSIYSIANLPLGATIFNNNAGLAPGMGFEKKGKWLISLPGVPSEMKVIYMEHLKDFISINYKIKQASHITIMTAGAGESMIAEKLQQFENELPLNIKLAYLPDFGVVKLRLTASDSSSLAKPLLTYANDIKSILGNWVFAIEDITLAQHIGNILKSKKWNLGIAESCTGGYLSHLITQHSGSSEYYAGSIVSYSNSLKSDMLLVPKESILQEGAVSETVCKAMLQGLFLKINCDVGIAITGIAGPNGGTVEKPVGTVHITVGKPENMVHKKVNNPRNRIQNIQWASNTALNMLRLWLIEHGNM